MKAIGHVTHTEQGVRFATGEPVVIPITHRKQKTAQYGSRFGQDIEPHGRYVLLGHLGQPGTIDEGWGNKVTTIHDTVHFRSPLVLHHGGTGSGPGGWKRRLSDAYGGKTGKALSRAVAKGGYDAVVTVDTYGRDKKKTISEIVDLTSFPFKPKKRNPTEPIYTDYMHRYERFNKWVESEGLKVGRHQGGPSDYFLVQVPVEDRGYPGWVGMAEVGVRIADHAQRSLSRVGSGRDIDVDVNIAPGASTYEQGKQEIIALLKQRLHENMEEEEWDEKYNPGWREGAHKWLKKRNPVRKVPGGWQWGSSKIHKTKTAAQRQARAVYASGWEEPMQRNPASEWAGEGIDFKNRYLDAFFAEKQLPIAVWTVEDQHGTAHIIDSNVVLEHVAVAPRAEKKQISDVIRQIDFKNGDVNHFLRHLAQAVANAHGGWGERNPHGELTKLAHTKANRRLAAMQRRSARHLGHPPAEAYINPADSLSAIAQRAVAVYRGEV